MHLAAALFFNLQFCKLQKIVLAHWQPSGDSTQEASYSKSHHYTFNWISEYSVLIETIVTEVLLVKNWISMLSDHLEVTKV